MDPEGYKAYVAENATAFRKYGARFLTEAGRARIRKANHGLASLFLSFNLRRGRRVLSLPEYARAMALRSGKSIMDLAIVPGYEGPQPEESANRI